MVEPVFKANQIRTSNFTPLPTMLYYLGGECSMIPCYYSSSVRSFEKGTLEPCSYVWLKDTFNTNITNLIIRLPFMRFRSPIYFLLLLEFSQNHERSGSTSFGRWGKWRQQKSHGSRPFIRYLLCKFRVEALCPGSTRKRMILTMGRTGEDKKENALTWPLRNGKDFYRKKVEWSTF